MEPGPDQIIKANSIPPSSKVEAPQFWHTASFMFPWLRDAYLESIEEGREHRRKEVIFAVCFFETFLFEWVRDDILKNDYQALFDFFPPDRHMPIMDRCKTVLNRLHQAKKVLHLPVWGNIREWEHFSRLVEIRDALAHAAVSRPFQDSRTSSQKDRVPISDFIALRSGWALRVVTVLASELYQAAGMEIPTWLLEPHQSLAIGCEEYIGIRMNTAIPEP